MTDRERRAVLKRNVAERDLATARAKLRQALVYGENTSAIRREIEALAARVEQAEAELAEMSAADERVRSVRLAADSAKIADGAMATVAAKLAVLRPAKAKPINEGSKL